MGVFIEELISIFYSKMGENDFRFYSDFAILPKKVFFQKNTDFLSKIKNDPTLQFFIGFFKPYAS